MEETSVDIEKVSLCPAAIILVGQIDKRWPDREKTFDNFLLNDVEDLESEKSYILNIDSRIGPPGKMRDGLVAEEFATQMIDYVRRGVPGSERIESVTYKNRSASGEYKDRFWIWRNGNFGCIEYVQVVFKKLGYEDSRKFQLPIFSTKDESPELFVPKKAVEIPKYPGKDRLSFGEKNQSVRKLQNQLLAKSYDLPFGATSEYDDQTKAAVRLLYHKMRKNSSGKDVGPAAWNFLFGE